MLARPQGVCPAGYAKTCSVLKSVFDFDSGPGSQVPGLLSQRDPKEISPTGAWTHSLRQICLGKPRLEGPKEAEDRRASGRRISPEAVPEQSRGGNGKTCPRTKMIALGFRTGLPLTKLHITPGRSTHLQPVTTALKETGRQVSE